MRPADAHPDSDIEIPVPPRHRLLSSAFAFAAALTLALGALMHYLLRQHSPGSSMGFGALLLLGAVTLFLSCVAALVAFRRLQLPLEAARALSLEQAFRIDELQNWPDQSAGAADPRVVETAQHEIAALKAQLGEMRAALAQAERRAADVEAEPVAAAIAPQSDAAPDPLTGLPTGHESFERALAAQIDSARRDGRFHGLLLIAIDRLDRVLDEQGPAAGEENVWQVAQLLREHLPKGGMAFRLSAKHFAVLLPGATDSESQELAQRLCSDIGGREFAWKGRPVPTSVSVGVVSIGLGDESVTDLIERAMHALVEAAKLGGGHVYRESLAPTLERRAREKSIGDWLRARIEQRQLRLAAQPILPANPDPSAPRWLELLLRIEDDDGIWLAPDHYGDVLERLQLTPQVDQWVLETALAEGKQLKALRDGGGRLSINLFGSSLLRDSFFATLRDALRRSALPTQQIVFELDEAFVVQHASRVRAFLDEIGEFGCQVALDRYRGGVGLSALRQFPAKYVKLHESLVQRQAIDLIDRAHIDWLLRAAHLVGSKVVASAVRDEETLARMREAGIDYVQGFAIAPPSPYAH